MQRKGRMKRKMNDWSDLTRFGKFYVMLAPFVVLFIILAERHGYKK
jgi:hypothetical protein